MPKQDRYADDRRITDCLPAKTVARRIEQERDEEARYKRAAPLLRRMARRDRLRSRMVG